MSVRLPSDGAKSDAGVRSDQVAVAWILAVLLRDRKVVLVSSGLSFAMALMLALWNVPYYTASFAFLPQSGQDQNRAGLASLAGQFGISLGSISGPSQPPQLYADLLKTRELLGGFARDSVVLDGAGARGPLSAFLGIRDSDAPLAFDETIRVLRERIVSSSVDARTTGVVTVRARTRSPTVSLQIAQSLLDGLHRFNRATRQSQAGEERRFTEGRLEAARASLRIAEDSLQEFLQANRQFNSASQLEAQRDRFQREVVFRQQVFTGLAQQYEDARIREVRDTPVITVIEKPVLPVLPDPRGRLRLLIVLTGVGFSFGTALVLAREGWRRRRDLDGDDPSYALLATELQHLRALFGKG